MAKPVGTLGTVPTINIGGSTAVGSTLIMLCADIRGNGPLVSTFRAWDGVNYTPSGSNKFYATGMIVKTIAGSNNPDIRLGYGTSGVGFGSGSLPTSPKMVGYGTIAVIGDLSNAINLSPAVTSNSASPDAYVSDIPLYVPFPNGSYPFVGWTASLTAGDIVLMYGYEAP